MGDECPGGPLRAASHTPAAPRIQIDRAAERTVELLGAPSGVVVITDSSFPSRDDPPAWRSVPVVAKEKDGDELARVERHARVGA